MEDVIQFFLRFRRCFCYSSYDIKLILIEFTFDNNMIYIFFQKKLFRDSTYFLCTFSNKFNLFLISTFQNRAKKIISFLNHRKNLCFFEENKSKYFSGFYETKKEFFLCLLTYNFNNQLIFFYFMLCCLYVV